MLTGIPMTIIYIYITNVDCIPMAIIYITNVDWYSYDNHIYIHY